MEHFIIVNGVDHAFCQEFGCECRRCTMDRLSANTSVSLVSVDNDRVIHHVLFDVGLGVVDSLVANSWLRGDRARLDQLMLSHWHADHVLGLNRLCETWRRTQIRREQPFKRIPVWCRQGSASWLGRNNSYELTMLDVHSSGESNGPGVLLDPIEYLGVRVMPITVSHCTADFGPDGEELNCCAGFVVEIREGKKAVLLWDIDNRNDWIVSPSEEQRCSVELLSHADYLFISSNTWRIEETGGKNTGHASFETVTEYVNALEPRLVCLVHVSGHEDGIGNPGWGWDDRQWEHNAELQWRTRGINCEVCVPGLGDQFEL